MNSRYIAYGLGKQAALEKIALNPLITRTLAGAGLGAGMGALTAGEGNRGTGALMGGALGGLTGGLGGRAVNRAREQLSLKGPAAIQSRLFTAPESAINAIGGAGLGMGAGLASGLGARATATPEPTWQDRLKGLVGINR